MKMRDHRWPLEGRTQLFASLDAIQAAPQPRVQDAPQDGLQGKLVVGLRNICPFGVRIETDQTLPRNAMVRIVLAGVPKAALVRWASNGLAGLRLVQTLTDAEIAVIRKLPTSHFQTKSSRTGHMKQGWIVGRYREM